jgi:D-xylose transport system ATP-binding protein
MTHPHSQAESTGLEHTDAPAPSAGVPPRPPSTPVLEVRGASKAYGAVQALYRVNFEVRAGEVMALVGDNGAGKSTLIKGIAGSHQFDEGEIIVDGDTVDIATPRAASQLGIEVVYQDLALADNLDVVSNLFLGREETTFPGRLKEDNMEQRTREIIKELAVSNLRSVRTPVASLSGGQRQAVAVARAVMWNSRVVILDEPTAALGIPQTAQVLDLVRRLANRGLGVVLISHNLHDVFQVADRVTVLRLGQSIDVFRREDVTHQDVVEAITAGEMAFVPGMETA